MTTRKLPIITNQKKAIQLLALVLLQKRREWHEAYEQDVDEWYRSGEGRKGYAYPSCIHGTSRITDYDNICGGCENGYDYFDYLRDLEDSIGEAKMYFNMRTSRLTELIRLLSLRAPVSDELWDWANEPVSNQLKGTSWTL